MSPQPTAPMVDLEMGDDHRLGDHVGQGSSSIPSESEIDRAAPNLESVERPYAIRLAQPTDLPFVLDSWLRSHLAVAAGRKGRWSPERRQHWYVENRPLVTRMVEELEILVACAVEDPDHILGWLAHDSQTVAYYYVKHVYRGYGVARELHKAAGFRVR